MEKEEVYEKIEKAFAKLLENDKYLLDVNINERSLTHKLAEYLQEEFPEWNVDCEYDRDALDAKRLQLNVHKSKVYPDIIVHHRGDKKNNNLIAIEAKKVKEGENIEETEEYKDDIKKLKGYKEQLRYTYTFMIKLPVEKMKMKVSDCIKEIKPSTT